MQWFYDLNNEIRKKENINVKRRISFISLLVMKTMNKFVLFITLKILLIMITTMKNYNYNKKSETEMMDNFILILKNSFFLDFQCHIHNFIQRNK